MSAKQHLAIAHRAADESWSKGNPEEVAPPGPSVSQGERSSRTVRLADGRLIGYADYGDPSGQPLLFFHGGGGSRLLGELVDEPARRLGLRVVAPDRPGIGLSDDQPRRSLLDWAQDVGQLADHLDLGRFAVLGLSNGGPFVCACARAIPERLTAAVIVSGMGTPEAPTAGQLAVTRMVLGLSRRFPTLYGALFAALVRRGRKHPERFVEQFFVGWPAADRAALARPPVGAIVTKATFEGYRRGGRAVGSDVALATRTWGFRLEDVPMHVHLWHGEADTIVPPATARYMAATLPDCVATYCRGEGHLSVLINHLDEILEAVAAAASGHPRHQD